MYVKNLILMYGKQHLAKEMIWLHKKTTLYLIMIKLGMTVCFGQNHNIVKKRF